eukprot:GFUD01016006.1.p1 GENE.GFUD01016006.1~~GFUD01016006.1.p1  ORF type:complete len:435 (+),score=74.44 GFUD01016006.1:108-1412(+)
MQVVSAVPGAVGTTETDSLLCSYLTTGQYADMTIITEDGKLDTHSVILAHSCPWLGEILVNHFDSFMEIIISVPGASCQQMGEAVKEMYRESKCDKFEGLVGYSSANSKPETLDNEQREYRSYGDMEKQSEKNMFQSGTTEVKKEKKQTIRMNQSAFQCDYCSSNFSTKAKLLKHSTNTHREKHVDEDYPGDFVVCGKDFEKCLDSCHSKVNMHKMVEDAHRDNKNLIRKAKRWSCEECGKQISSANCLKTHIDAIHRGIKHNCPHCEFSTGWPKKLSEHVLFHHSDPILKYQCVKCGKKFRNKATMDLHETSHNPKTIRCNHCEKLFNHNKYLDRHMETVHGDKKFPCQECGKLFTTQEYVSIHFKSVHLNHAERKHKCDICGQGFSKKMAFNSHMNKHLGLRPFKCPALNCGKCFSDDTALSHHKRKCSIPG